MTPTHKATLGRGILSQGNRYQLFWNNCLFAFSNSLANTKQAKAVFPCHKKKKGDNCTARQEHEQGNCGEEPDMQEPVTLW